MTYTSGDTGKGEKLVQSFQADGSKEQVSNSGGTNPRRRNVSDPHSLLEGGVVAESLFSAYHVLSAMNAFDAFIVEAPTWLIVGGG